MTTDDKAKKQVDFTWMLYLSLIISAVLFLGYTYQWFHLHRWTAQIGVSLLVSVFFLIVSNGRKIGIISSLIIWITVLSILILK